MPVYFLATAICLYFFRDKILGVFCSRPGYVRANVQTALLAVFVSFFPLINGLVAFGMVIGWLWQKIAGTHNTPA